MLQCPSERLPRCLEHFPLFFKRLSDFLFGSATPFRSGLGFRFGNLSRQCFSGERECLVLCGGYPPGQVIRAGFITSTGTAIEAATGLQTRVVTTATNPAFHQAGVRVNHFIGPRDMNRLRLLLATGADEVALLRQVESSSCRLSLLCFADWKSAPVHLSVFRNAWKSGEMLNSFTNRLKHLSQNCQQSVVISLLLDTGQVFQCCCLSERGGRCPLRRIRHS